MPARDFKVLGRMAEEEHCHLTKIVPIDNPSGHLYRVPPSNTSAWSHARVRAFRNRDRHISFHQRFVKGRYDTVVCTEKVTTRR